MGKDDVLTLRVDRETKRRITHAAKRQNKSITAFVLETTMKAVQRIERQPETQAVRGPCPSFFKACCATAAMGGGGSYKWAGHQLAGHVRRLCPWELEEEEWLARLDGLYELVEEGAEDEAIVDWLEENLPRCVALVPTRRRPIFIEGMLQHFEDHGFDV